MLAEHGDTLDPIAVPGADLAMRHAFNVRSNMDYEYICSVWNDDQHLRTISVHAMYVFRLFSIMITKSVLNCSF
jgi:hypothetical protein